MRNPSGRHFYQSCILLVLHWFVMGFSCLMFRNDLFTRTSLNIFFTVIENTIDWLISHFHLFQLELSNIWLAYNAGDKYFPCKLMGADQKNVRYITKAVNNRKLQHRVVIRAKYTSLKSYFADSLNASFFSPWGKLCSSFSNLYILFVAAWTFTMFSPSWFFCRQSMSVSKAHHGNLSWLPAQKEWPEDWDNRYRMCMTVQQVTMPQVTYLSELEDVKWTLWIFTRQGSRTRQFLYFYMHML